MTDPLVTFVVPCYKLGHLLSECVTSILSQTYESFEVLIMDDCSPDQTADVARSFFDSRVRYIRNETNLGNLGNYNKGIRLARGKYIWLISADDRLRKPYVLERYVRVLEDHPDVGYVFCAAVEMENGHETRVLDYSIQGNKDALFKGRAFVAKLLNGNTVIAASAMARKECYEKVSLFPLDLPWGGDWYLWCIFALYYDVAQLAEPMVNYRRHELSMTDALVGERIRNCAESEVTVLRRVMGRAVDLGCASLARKCMRAIAAQYAEDLASRKYRSSTSWHEYSMTLEEFDESLGRDVWNARQKRFIRARAYAGAADRYYWRGEFSSGLEFYGRGLREDAAMPKVWIKYFMLRLGTVGIRFRAGLLALRQMTRVARPRP
jgi:glycosyltransferase involved in cell wall biosynthesis